MLVNNFEGVYKKGKRLWAYMNQRCGNKKNTAYKYYGAKGIKVKMSFDDFMYWFVTEAKEKSLKDISVSRIDHSESYFIGNIKLETRSENSKERVKRLSNPSLWPKRPISAIKMGEAFNFESVSEASRILNLDASTISKCCLGKVSGSRGYTFKYLEAK